MKKQLRTAGLLVSGNVEFCPCQSEGFLPKGPKDSLGGCLAVWDLGKVLNVESTSVLLLPIRKLPDLSKMLKINAMKYIIIIEKTRTGYSAYVPDLPGCISTGDTKDETETNIQEAILFHIEGLKEDGLPIPSPNSEVLSMSIAM